MEDTVQGLTEEDSQINIEIAVVSNRVTDVNNTMQDVQEMVDELDNRIEQLEVTGKTVCCNIQYFIAGLEGKGVES